MQSKVIILSLSPLFLAMLRRTSRQTLLKIGATSLRMGAEAQAKIPCPCKVTADEVVIDGIRHGAREPPRG